MTEINREIKQLLKENSIEYNQAQLYLLGVFFNIDTASIRSDVKTEVNLLNIFRRDGKEVVWEIPLFAGMESNWQWVEEYREKFARINPERKSTLKDCMKRMRKFFSEYPEVRKEDVLKATDHYLTTLDEPKFLKSANYFIYKGTIADSQLATFIEIIKEREKLIRRPARGMM